MTVVHRIEHPPRVTEQLSLMKKTCKHCGIVISRSPDMIRHCMRHLSKEDRIKLMQFCSFPGCSFSTLQSSNLKNHERKHTNKQRCCDAIIIKKDGGTERCTFSTQDNGSLTNHKKSVHGQGAKYAPRDKRGAQRGQRKVFITPTSHPERSLRGCSGKQRSTRSDPLASVYVQDVVPSYSGTTNTSYDIRLRADPHGNHFSPIFPTDQAHRQLTGTQFGDLSFSEFASPQPSSPIAIPDYYRDSALGDPSSWRAHLLDHSSRHHHRLFKTTLGLIITRDNEALSEGNPPKFGKKTPAIRLYPAIV
ncbi:hypothetical protein A0H81_06810 [Grifola frondosa]|uniref:C2H2-type domain-containing protein n=1 Tax=Grifola frondosa TaxID=5627 RepID=A0A1C7M9R1_GRIFR|nr:hypothetical protein A0H81_06810 [Grifola frondosa]